MLSFINDKNHLIYYKTKMKILIVCWFDAPRAQVLIAKNSFEKLKHNVECFGLMEHHKEQNKLVEKVDNFKPDMLLVWHRGMKEELYKLVRDKVKKIIIFNWDDPHSCKERGCEEYLSCMKYMDKAFSCCEETKNIYLSNGCKDWQYLIPMYGDFHKYDYDKKYECDISLICTNLYDSFKDQPMRRRDLVNELYKNEDINFHLYAPPHIGKQYPRCYKGEIPYEINRKVFSSSKINISTHCTQGEGYVNERCITILASGGLLLVDNVKGIDKLFGDCCVVMKDINNVIDQIRDILNNYDKYEHLKKRGLEVVKRYHVGEWCKTLLN